ncbi:GlxA family transcriptional regulator [Mycobacterium sp. 1164966.3]|uniref:GlxA family transcriptional regulator n=1 Tax=Mycobacterium sp. 1164966.3 TaxID=1856861 RepID=UPI00352C7A90
MAATSRVVVTIVFERVTLLDAAGPAEVFVAANRFGAHYQLKVASVDGQDVTTSIGTKLGVTDSISAIDSADTVIVAGGDTLVGRQLDPALVEALGPLSARSRRLASVCTGSFVLAQAGLLSGRRATTHWRHAPLLAREFPDTCVEPDAIFVRDGEIFTSAGVSAGIDLALALVELDYGAELVREVARALVVYLKRAGGQSQFSVLVEADPPSQSVLRSVTAAIAANPDADHSVKSLAARASLSKRQLARLFQSELATTPARYVEMVRIDIARAQLEGGRTVARTAQLAGFGSAETLRRVFVNRLGVSPKAYQDRFRTTVRSADDASRPIAPPPTVDHDC